MIGLEISQYRLEEKLGEGGMGVVYKAVDTVLDRVVAIKLLSSHLTENSELLDRFKAEAKMQATLSHPNIATLYTYLVWEGRAVMVMEFIEGETLHQMIARQGAIPAAVAIPLFKQALLGVGAAHRRGIVHRDIKPANIMVNTESHVKVMDFGIAKVLGVTGTTRTNVHMGTALYMAPEQVLSKPVDSRTDIYALGVTLYEILSGRVPFRANSDYEVLSAHVQRIPELPTEYNPDIPQPCVDAIMRALAKEPENRFATTEDFCAALDRTANDCAGATSAPGSTSNAGTSARGLETIFVQSPQALSVPEPAPLAKPAPSGPNPAVRVPPPMESPARRPSWMIPAIVAGSIAVVAAIGAGIYALHENQYGTPASGHHAANGPPHPASSEADRRMQEEQDRSADELQRKLEQERAQATPAPPPPHASGEGQTRPAPVQKPQVAPSPAPPSPGTAPAPQAGGEDAARLTMLTGTWSGTYMCSQGVRGVTLQMVATSDQKIGALLQFAVPNSQPGSYFMRGTFNPADNRLSLKFMTWKYQPQGYTGADVSGVVNFQGREYRGVVLQPGCAAFSVRKQ